MDIQQHQHKMREKVEVKQRSDECKEGQQASPLLAPPSASSSPTHEFSFTISLQPPPAVPDKTRTPPTSIAIDLSPADDIFFHGHLLPLHLLSHLPVSPRSSINSLDSFTLPIRELVHDQDPVKNTTTNNSETKGRVKSKSFSIFGLSKWRKGSSEIGEENIEEKEKHKRKLKIDHVSHVLKRYMSMVRPLLSHFRERKEKIRMNRQSYSFSGDLGLRGKRELRGRRGEFSAPASMRTSPTNSGLLVATSETASSSTSESTMEELQAAIQAAIAHCKNSIATEEKIKC